jgi:hypothetical protein
MTAKDLIPFVKNDPRINRKGRPKAFDAWRKLLIDLSNEPAVQRDKDNRTKKLVLIQIPKTLDGRPVVDDLGNPVMEDHYATNAEMIARQWMSDPKRQQNFVEGAFGKVPTPIQVSGEDGGAIQIEYINTPYPTTSVSSESSGDTQEPE